MTQDGEPIIRVTDLKKYYGAVKAVDGVSFEVGRGEVFGMLGPNGAGKTTTIEVLEGLRPPDSGSVEVLGLDVRHHPESIKGRIGVQLQGVSLYPRLTVTELLDLFGTFFAHHLPTQQLIDAVDLRDSADVWSLNLSGGQQQRLSIALALVNDPELVFLDEPTTGLDPQARRSLWDLIKGLQERGKSVMLTTPDCRSPTSPSGRRPGTVIHSDQGTQFTSWAFTRRALDSGLMPSMGAVGRCFDNALIESFWSRMQVELLDRRTWRTRVELATAIFEHLVGEEVCEYESQTAPW